MNLSSEHGKQQGEASMKTQVTLKNAEFLQRKVELIDLLRVKLGADRVVIAEEDVFILNLKCAELEQAFEAEGLGNMTVMGINREKGNHFLWEDDNEGGYGENYFSLEWDGKTLTADCGGHPINEWTGACAAASACSMRTNSANKYKLLDTMFR
jgi:hypothetical protein